MPAKRGRAAVPPHLRPGVGLQCPRCGCRHLVNEPALESKRVVYIEDGIRRTRYCRHCGHAVVTTERIVGYPTNSPESPPQSG